ncbi:hypothetical protein GE21DRAFT_8204 [Neurospora crassa]|uniref:Putative transcription factor kapC n=2 Tax=Neurospora crassa TaxID=5141 RepID=Q1K7C7_NEUCR|nr:hypothetical protein NCU04211 [Neurospora crassa OR74A]EAA31935.2 hypothetical protein NCU04211 [Neurospora crassa OR74A]KHE86061.1 hypothetical protein GE21DRAFT_8204 [Neurospora crassa]|eukprot:XP_961171.2 hypothetical protein NCU04211 [Neurospora crassa OR74A]
MSKSSQRYPVTSQQHCAMEDFNHLVDMPTSESSFRYMYAESDRYLDVHSSGSQSSVSSPYDVASFMDPNIYAGTYQGLESEDESSQQPTQEQKPKRKRENRYKNAPPSVLSRRRAQNRASQRAYRERKDQRIKDLEQMLNEAKQHNNALGQAYAALQAEYEALKASQFKDIGYSTANNLTYQPSPLPTTSTALSSTGFDLDLYAYHELSANGGYHMFGKTA